MKKSVNLYVLAASVATAAAVHGFEATLADPLAWLYPDSKVASAERIGEIDGGGREHPAERPEGRGGA